MPSFFGPMDNPPFVPDGMFRGPPRNLPGLSAQRALLHQSETLGVGLYRFESFSTGFRFTVEVEGRGHGPGRFHFLFDPSDSWGAHGHGDDPDPYDQPGQQFRLGLEFSDGTRWENFVEEQHQGLGVRTFGGGWGSGCSHQLWVPRLPTPGELSVHGLWPSVGMNECTATLDADEIVSASRAEIQLLP